MKRNLLWALALLLCVACASEKKDIEKAVYAYLDAMGNYKIDDARPYASIKTCETTLDVIQKNLMPKVDTNYIKSNTPATIEIQGVEVLSDTTAVVNYKKTTPITTQNDGRLDMIKEDGRWCAEVIINIAPELKQDTLRPSLKLDSLKGMTVKKGTVIKK